MAKIFLENVYTACWSSKRKVVTNVDGIENDFRPKNQFNDTSGYFDLGLVEVTLGLGLRLGLGSGC